MKFFKRIAVIVLLILGSWSIIFSQKVGNIRTEQAGDLIKIYYKILDSDPSQTFRVTVYCSLNGGLKSELKSISGDYGDNVVGGRDEYMVLWDALKDVEEVKSVEFFVKAELINTIQAGAQVKKDWRPKKIIAQVTFQGPYSLFGGRIGYTGKWGVTATYSGGTAKVAYYSVPGLYCATISLTKSLLYQNSAQLHVFAGMAFAEMNIEENFGTFIDHYTENVKSFDLGLIFNASRLSVSAATSYFADPKDMSSTSEMDNFRLCIGLGLRF
jgi:hypothetical protein